MKEAIRLQDEIKKKAKFKESLGARQKNWKTIMRKIMRKKRVKKLFEKKIWKFKMKIYINTYFF